MKAPGFLRIKYYGSTNGNHQFYLIFKGAALGYPYFNLELKQWYHLRIENRSIGHPDNKCSTTFHVDFNQIFEKVTDCGSYSATETELYASCASYSCLSVSGVVDSMRFVWLQISNCRTNPSYRLYLFHICIVSSQFLMSVSVDRSILLLGLVK